MDIALGGHEHIYERYWPIYDFQVHVYTCQLRKRHLTSLCSCTHFVQTSEVQCGIFVYGREHDRAGESALYTHEHLQDPFCHRRPLPNTHLRV